MQETHSFLLLRSFDKSENPAHDEPRTRVRNTIVGENQAFAEDVVRRFFPRLGLDKINDYDDCVSEAYIALICAVERFEPEYGVPFQGYCAIVIANHLREFAKKRATGDSIRYGYSSESGALSAGVLDDCFGALEDFSDAVISRIAIKAAVAAAFCQLEEHLATERDVQSWARQKSAIKMRYFQDKTYLAIALQLGVTPEAAEKIVVRGSERLKPHLAFLLTN